MHSSLPNPTKDQERRFQDIQSIGCVACLLKSGAVETPCDIHHLTDCGRRISHDDTVGLCPWHHRGIPDDGFSEFFVRKVKGPSYAKAPAAFRDEFGDDETLLITQNVLIDCYLKHGLEPLRMFKGGGIHSIQRIFDGNA